MLEAPDWLDPTGQLAMLGERVPYKLWSYHELYLTSQ